MVFQSVPSVGLDQLDQEHQALFRLSEALREAASGDAPAGELLRLLEDFLHTSVEHFENEEAMLEPYRLRNTRPHNEEHAKLIAELVALRECATAGSTDSNWRLVLTGLTDRLFNHIIAFDFEVKRHITNSESD